MSITRSSLWRGCAANFPQPVTEEDQREAQFLVETVHYFNCFVLHPSLPRIVYRSSHREQDILRHVFRWNLTPYKEVFQHGFRCRREEHTPEDVYLSLEEYVNNGGRPLDNQRFTTHAFVSTTLDTRWRPPTRSVSISTEVYRYEIYAPGGIHVAATLGQYYQYPAQDEVCFVAGVAPQYIRSAQRFRLTRSAGTGRRRWRRVNNELVINERINPQAHPFRELDVQTPLDSILEDGSIANLFLTYYPTSNRKKRSTDDAADWYAVDVADIGSYIDAAFRSFCANEAYLFMKNEYVRIDYAPGSKNDNVLGGPRFISDGFPILRGTAFGEYGIDCAFGSSSGTGQAYIFSGNLCALIDYNPGTTDDKIIEGPKTIAAMFPFLKRTVFENGIDVAFESTTEYEAYVFKGNQNARINYEGSGSITVRPINEGFPCLKYTMFEDGVDAAFASHKYNEAYLFKGDSYALINFAPATQDDYIVGGQVKKIKPNWPSLDKILPRKNHGLDNYQTDSNSDEDEPDSDCDHDEL